MNTVGTEDNVSCRSGAVSEGDGKLFNSVIVSNGFKSFRQMDP